MLRICETRSDPAVLFLLSYSSHVCATAAHVKIVVVVVVTITNINIYYKHVNIYKRVKENC